VKERVWKPVWRRVFAGYRWVRDRVVKRVREVVQDGWKYVTREVPRYATRLVRAGWRFVTKTVPRSVMRKVRVGWRVVKKKVPVYGGGIGKDRAPSSPRMHRSSFTKIGPSEEFFVPTGSLVLKGGPGSAVSYSRSAEESYTEHPLGGNVPRSLLLLQVFTDALAWIRDTTPLLDWLVQKGWRKPDVETGIYVRPQDFTASYLLTAIQVENHTNETMHVARAQVTVDKRQEILLPFQVPTVVSSMFNSIQPGQMARLNVGPMEISSKRAELEITIISETGRVGTLKQTIAIGETR
jgi:hypothetical protein